MPDTGHGLVHSLLVKLALKRPACVLVSSVRMKNRFCIRIISNCFIISIKYKLVVVSPTYRICYWKAVI